MTDGYNIPNDPTENLPFEIEPLFDEEPAERQGERWSFAPEYYPDRLPLTKDRELNRDGQQCGGEDISIKQVKNREFHVSGVVLAREVPILNNLIDWEDEVDIYSPLTPTGGMECIVKNGEIDATPEGFDGVFREWRFTYTLDLVSTGLDEYDHGHNAIVTALVNDSGQ